MSRLKSQPRPITTFKQKRYKMNKIFKENSASPQTSPNRGGKTKPVPNAPEKKVKTVDLTSRVIFDVCATLVNLESIMEVLEMFPCMSEENDIDIRIYKRYFNGDTANQGRLIIDTEFSLLDKEAYIITQLLESFNINEDYAVKLPISGDVIRSFWSE